MKLQEKNKNSKILTIFVVTFVIAFVVIFQIAKMISPSVDVEISSEEAEDVSDTEKDDSVKKMIDERLKWIQFEDNSKNEKTENSQTDENDTEYKVMKDSDELFKTEETVNVPAPEFEPIVEQKQIKTAPVQETRVYKVYIGEYQTIEQALTVQTQVMDANVGITPYIKNINGKFILQAGSFSNKDKAIALTDELTRQGLPVQIIQE